MDLAEENKEIRATGNYNCHSQIQQRSQIKSKLFPAAVRSQVKGVKPRDPSAAGWEEQCLRTRHTTLSTKTSVSQEEHPLGISHSSMNCQGFWDSGMTAKTLFFS